MPTLIRAFLLSLLLCMSCIAFSPPVQAGGFGATPPYIKSDALRPGTTFRQEVFLVRGEPTEDLVAHVSVDLPTAGAWIHFEPGSEVSLPKGVKQVPLIVFIRVPADAPLGSYAGTVRIETVPTGTRQAGVGVAVGAQLDVELGVTDARVMNVRVRRVELAPAAEGRDVLWTRVPAKVRATLRVENAGNVSAAPDRIVLSLSHPGIPEVLAEAESVNRLHAVPPFSMEEVAAEFPVDLPIGEYHATYRVLQGTETLKQGIALLRIRSRAELPDAPTYGVWAIPGKDQLIVLAMLAFLLSALRIAILRVRRTA